MPFCIGRLKLKDFRLFLKEFLVVAYAERSEEPGGIIEPMKGQRKKLKN